LEFHLDGQADLVEAANALPRCDRRDLGGHENPIVKSFQADIEIDRRSLGNERDTFAQSSGCGENEIFFSVFSGAM
jgi:hypothetical protein